MLVLEKALVRACFCEIEILDKDNLLFSSSHYRSFSILKNHSAQKMLEFVTTGTFDKLEEKRAAHA